MTLTDFKGFKIVTSDLFSKYNIKHFFSTISDESTGNKSVTFGFREDNREEVLKNYEKVADYFNVPVTSITKSTQVHKDVVMEVEECHIGMGVTKKTMTDNADGLITDVEKIPLCIFTADCVPVLIADKKGTVVSAVHSGWRGTVMEITVNSINTMTEKYGIKKEDIICAIGPCISKCCFEVSKEVIDEVLKIKGAESTFYAKENEKYMLDLKELNKLILLNAGIPEENIDVSDMCTKCEDELFFSYRRQGEKAGRNASFIMKG